MRESCGFFCNKLHIFVSDRSQEVASERVSTSQDNESDKRYFPRWSVVNRVLYQKQGHQEALTGNTKDLSCSGACIVINEELPLNEKLKLIIYLSGDSCIKVDGKITWITVNNGQKHIGITFNEMSQKDQEVLLEHAYEINRDKWTNHWFKGWDGN